MRSMLLAAICFGLVAVLPAAASSEASDSKRATLRAVDMQPLRLAGSGFKPQELVVVTVSVGAQSTSRRLRVSHGGTFSLQVPEVTVDRCSGLSAAARGARGSLATYKRPLPLCPPRLEGPGPEERGPRP
jgi:hypothetical protein